MSKSLDFFREYIQDSGRDNLSILQAEIIDKIIEEQLDFDYIECIETGCASGRYDNFGIYLSKYCQEKNGKFSTVDVSKVLLDESKILYEKILGKNKNAYFCQDSISFLKSYGGSPNLIHLDSLDLDLKNPVPSMLHGWMEFDSVREKMPSGSLCIIDDNFLRGTLVYWDWFDDFGNLLSTETIEIPYEIIGKGSLIYHWVKNQDSGWDIVGDHYKVGDKFKLVIKKR